MSVCVCGAILSVDRKVEDEVCAQFTVRCQRDVSSWPQAALYQSKRKF